MDRVIDEIPGWQFIAGSGFDPRLDRLRGECTYFNVVVIIVQS